LQSKENELQLYGTVYDVIDKDIMALLYEMFVVEITITMDTQLQKQEKGIDCGVFCITIATSLLHGLTILLANMSNDIFDHT